MSSTQKLLLALLLLFRATPACAAPETLFAWPGRLAGTPDGADEPDEIVTDRPDFTEASSTVGQGVFQIEAGYTFSRDRHSGIQGAHSLPEVLLRIGMFADWFELRIGVNATSTPSLTVDGARLHTTGLNDLYLGVKLGLTAQAGPWPESALIFQMTVPTGTGGTTDGRVLPGMNLLYGWDVIPDCLAIGASTQANLVCDDTRLIYLEVAQSLTVNYTLTEKLGAFTEVFAFFPHGSRSPGVVPQYYFDGGFTYKFTPNFQYDIRAGVGLNRYADDFFAGTGFAVRF